MTPPLWPQRALTVLAAAYAIAPPATADDRIEAAFNGYARAHPNLAVALIVSRSEGDEAFVAGPVRPGSDQAATLEGPWHVGSVAKPFTATLATQLAERGVLDLDAPIGAYLDAEDAHPDWQALTLRELLSHGSGLRSNPPITAWLRWPEGDPSAAVEAELARLWDAPIEGERGTFAYSNLGYMLAAHVVASAAGRPWRDLIADEIAGPLGLASLGYGAPTGDGSPWGQRDIPLVGGAVDPTARLSDNPGWMDAAGRMHMSLPDLTAWGRAHLDACAGRPGAILSQASCETMRRPVTGHAGLGWLIGRPGPHGADVVWHNGSNTLWYAMLMLVPEHDAVVVMAQNRFDLEATDALLAEVLAVVATGD